MFRTLFNRGCEVGGSLTAPLAAYFFAQERLAGRGLTVSAELGDIVLLADRTITADWMAAALAFFIANRLGCEIDRQRMRAPARSSAARALATTKAVYGYSER